MADQPADPVLAFLERIEERQQRQHQQVWVELIHLRADIVARLQRMEERQNSSPPDLSQQGRISSERPS